MIAIEVSVNFVDDCKWVCMGSVDAGSRRIVIKAVDKCRTICAYAYPHFLANFSPSLASGYKQEKVEQPK